MVGDKSKLADLIKCKLVLDIIILIIASQSFNPQYGRVSSSSSCSMKFNPMNTPGDLNCTPSRSSNSNMAGVQLPTHGAELNTSVKPAAPHIPRPPNISSGFKISSFEHENSVSSFQNSKNNSLEASLSMGKPKISTYAKTMTKEISLEGEIFDL